MARLRIGVVGPGLIWDRAHQPALQRLQDRVAITAFAAATDKHRAAIEQRYPAAPFLLDYEQLVAAPEVDWVLVLTPIPLNAAVTMAALRAGKNVFVEKPMANTLADAQAMVRLADETGRKLYVLEQDGYAPYLEGVQDALCSGRIGAPVAYDLVLHEVFDADRGAMAGTYPTTAWRIRPRFPLGTLFDGGHHPIARLSRLFGPPQGLYATASCTRPTYGEFHHVLTHLTYASGLRGSFSHASVLSDRRNSFTIWGTAGAMLVERNRFTIEPNDSAQPAQVVEFDARPLHDAMWQALLDAIAAGREPAYPKERALQDVSTLFAIDRSIHEGVPITL